MTRALARLALLLFVAVCIAPMAWMLWHGGEYWALSRELRAEHPLHLELASGAPWGVLVGLMGTALMVLMLLYTVRKLLVRLPGLGPLSGWLRFHIACGILGPLLIVMHAGLSWPTGLIAVGFWCMVAVALSGVFGRYVYGFFPRMADGRAMAWEDAMAQLVALRGELVAQTAGVRGDQIGRAVERVKEFDDSADSLLGLIALQREVGRREREVTAILEDSGLPEEMRQGAAAALCEQLRLRRGLEASRAAHRMMRYWHLFHRPLAGAMYVIISIHIASAVLLGGSLAQLAMLWK